MKKPMNRIQQRIVETLADKAMPVKEIAAATGVSDVYIRQQLQTMLELRLIEKVDERQPYYYKRAELDIKGITKVRAIKAGLMAKSAADIADNTPLLPFVMPFHKLPKAKWEAAAKELEYIQEAIAELVQEEKLIDTL